MAGIQSIVVTDQPATPILVACGWCPSSWMHHGCSGAKNNGTFDRRKTNKCHNPSYSTEDYTTWKNNQLVINQNFAAIAKQNSDLKQQIEQLNKEISELKATVTDTKNIMNEVKSEIKGLQQNTSELSEKLHANSLIIQTFVRGTTQQLVCLLTAAKTNTLQDLNIEVPALEFSS